jgi:uncharacterized protein (TIGR03435 family)
VSALAQAASAALIHSLWQDALVGMLLWAALAALTNRSAAVRYVVSCAGLTLLIVVPLATAAAFVLRAAPLDVRAVPMMANLRALVAPQPMLSIWMTPEAAGTLWLAQVQRWTLPVWSVGVLLFSVRLAWGSAQALTLGRDGTPAEESVLAIVADLAARMGVYRAVRVVTSSRVDGPSVLGWIRPIILLTPATALGLTTSELEAVIAHELAHVKRWDYLVNLCQVVAETVFFYHPAVWWASNRIRVERELCCDDLAIRSCGDPLCYARALTTLEKQRLSVPAMAMAVTGDPLLYRIQRMLGVSTQECGSGRWPGILALCMVLSCVSVSLDWTRLLAQTAPDARQFEVASIKPHKTADGAFGILGQPGGRFTATNATLRMLIRTAYQLQDDQIAGGPGWLGSDHFDIVAKAQEDVRFGPSPPGQGPGPMQLMLRSLLAERFKLVTHKETRELPIYLLQIARSDKTLGSSLRPSAVDCAARVPAGARSAGPGGPGGPQGAAGPGPSAPTAGRPACGVRLGPGTLVAGGTRLSQLATVLSPWVNRIVVDETGLTGGYDIDLQWMPDQMPQGLGGVPPPGAAPSSPIDPNRPSIFTAVQEQLGLKLISQKGPVEVLVIDHVEPPTED